jgi:hypothetical protein
MPEGYAHGHTHVGMILLQDSNLYRYQSFLDHSYMKYLATWSGYLFLEVIFFLFLFQ